MQDCLFLTVQRGHLVCNVGVNFCAVGDDRALCKNCTLMAMPDPDEYLECPYMDVYTYVSHADQQVRPILECSCYDGQSQVDAYCKACPAMAALPADVVAAD